MPTLETLAERLDELFGKHEDTFVLTGWVTSPMEEMGDDGSPRVFGLFNNRERAIRALFRKPIIDEGGAYETFTIHSVAEGVCEPSCLEAAYYWDPERLTFRPYDQQSMLLSPFTCPIVCR
jgi:hypothetical protein